MKKYISLLFLLTLALPFAANADTAPEHNYDVENCVTVDNLDDFGFYASKGDPDPKEHLYNVFVSQMNNGLNKNDSVQISPNETTCDSHNLWWEDWSPVIFAIETTSEVSPTVDGKMIPSNLHLDELNLSDENPIRKKLTIVHIDAIADGKMTLSLVRTDFFDNDWNKIKSFSKDEPVPGTRMEFTASQQQVTDREAPVDSFPNLIDTNSSQPSNTSQSPTTVSTPPPQTQIPISSVPPKQTFYSELASPLDAREIIFLILGLIGVGFAIKTWKN